MSAAARYIEIPIRGERNMTKINMTAVARRAGVSQPTVSRVVNGDLRVSPQTRGAVLAAARELGYPVVPRNRILRIGVIMSQDTPISSYQAMALSALKANIFRRGWKMQILFSEDLAEVNTLALGGAVSISGSIDLNRRWSETTVLPLVRFAALSSHENNIFSVYTDERSLIYRAAGLLARAGHRRIGLFLRRTEEQDRALIENLGAVFREVMPLFGVTSPEEWLSYGQPGRSTRERLRLLLEKGITAMIAVPGDTALELCAELRNGGIRIPDDLSLIARNFSGVSEYWDPPLTSLCPDYDGLSAAALSLLEEIHRGEFPPGDIAVPGSLKERRSVAPPRR